MNDRLVRLALGLRSTAQSLGVIGAASGLFAQHGVNLQLVREETTGPAGIRGLLQGDYEIAELGALPAVQAAMRGADTVIVLAPEKISALHLLGVEGVMEPSQLRGWGIGVLSRDGQTGASAQKIIEDWGLADTVRLVELGTYPKIYQALQERRIGAGVLTADYGIAGATRFGFKLLVDLGEALRLQGPVVATTHRFLQGNRALLAGVVKGYVDTIRFFKSNPDKAVPMLVRHLGFVDEPQARAIHSFYAARFQDMPYASEDGLRRIMRLLDAPDREVSIGQIYDPSFVTEACGLDKQGNLKESAT